MKKALSWWENFIKKESLKQKNKNTAIFENALVVEQLIENYCYQTGLRKHPDEWIIFSTDIIKYNTTDKKHSINGDFGQQYLQAAKNNFKSVYVYFEKQNQPEILAALDNLLALINQEITTCDLKIKNRKQ